ncbi:MAG: M23 family peptidase, partial [Tannerellaceae bacterium]|nr:M23 family peptidase [Tannerellaceae bacterium]
MAQKHRKKDFQTFWHQLRFKYKLSFINEGTLEEVWSFRMSQLSAIVVLLAFAFILIAFTSLII